MQAWTTRWNASFLCIKTFDAYTQQIYWNYCQSGFGVWKKQSIKAQYCLLKLCPLPHILPNWFSKLKRPYWQKNILIEKIEPLDFALLLAWIMVVRAWRILPSILRRSEPRRHSKSLRRPRRRCQAWPYLIQITHTSSNQNYMTEIKDMFKIVATLLQFVTGE